MHRALYKSVSKHPRTSHFPYQSYIFHTIALRFFHILHHDIGTNVSPLLYAELALKADGLQGYVDAMNEFN